MSDLMSLCEENEISKNANGGTERNKRKLYAGPLPFELLNEFQIVYSRVRDLNPNKIRIFVANDLPGDPESEFLKNGGWKKFHKLVFISNWQMQAYIAYYGIPWSHCEVMKYAIDPIEFKPRNHDKIKLIYTPTPHRGLQILYPVFDALTKKYENLELDVYSSFELYGWNSRDEAYKNLFDNLRNHPNINYHGTQSNDTVIAALQEAHIFAYPSIWQETFCLSLLEAMAAGCICVHPNLGCLYETSLGITNMYQWSEDQNSHANLFYKVLDGTIAMCANPNLDMNPFRLMQKKHVDMLYSWDVRYSEWNGFLTEILNSNPDRAIPGQMFSYRVN